MQFLHCGLHFAVQAVCVLPANPAETVAAFQQVHMAECPGCGERLMLWVGLDEGGAPDGLAREIKPEKQAAWLKRIEDYRNPPAPQYGRNGAAWVWGSNPQWPYDKRKVPVR